MIKLNDIYYIAGLLEGEGSFGFYETPVIQLNMTDFDVVNGAQKILHPGANIRTQNKGGNRKLMYILHISGSIALQWMMTIYPLMKERRQAKILEVINKWKEMKGVPQQKINELGHANYKMIKTIADASKISFDQAKAVVEKAGLLS